MLELHDLIHTCEDHLMLADDVAAAHGTDADLMRIPLLSALAAVILVRVCISECLIHTVCHRKRRPARCIDFAVVMLLDDLNVKACRSERLCRLF